MQNNVIVSPTAITVVVTPPEQESVAVVQVQPQVVNVTATVGSTGGGGGGGVTDHGELSGLGDDDHTQYLNNARGDVRYAPIVHTHAIADVTGLQTALDGKAATSHTHVIADVTGLQTALDGKQAAGSYADATHTHVIADVTGLQTALDGKAASSHTHVRADITDFAHTHPQSDITNLVSDLAGKQGTLVSGTNIRTVNGTSLLGSGDVAVSATMKTPGTELLKALGLSIIAETLGRSRSETTTAINLNNQQMWFSAVYLDAAATLTGVGWYQNVSGVYTAGTTNAIGLYTLSGGTFTKVAETANNGNLWKGTLNTEQRAAFTSSYAAAAGVYWVVALYNQSAQTTAPSIAAYPNSPNAAVSSAGMTGGNRLTGTLNSQTTLPATITASSVVNTNQQYYFFLY